MRDFLTTRSLAWLPWLGLLIFGVTCIPAHPAQSYDFRLSTLERQMDQLRSRLDQLEQMVAWQRSEANRPVATPENVKLLTLEKQQDLILGRLTLLERTWQSTEATLQQVMKERQSGHPQREEKPKRDGAKPKDQAPNQTKDRPR